MIRELTCIICPRGCHLQIDDDLNVSGNHCPRGAIYAKSELTDPRRTLTTTVRLLGKERTRLSVKTSAPIPKGLMLKAMDELASVVMKAPVAIGDIVLRDVCGTGISVIATRTVKE